MTKGQVLEFFSKYGEIDSIDLKPRPDNPHKNTGYCVLEVHNKLSFQKIISFEHLEIFPGRYVVCKPFMKGTELKKATKNLDKRRLIVKHVPSIIKERDLWQYFERFAAVENIFPFHHDTSPVDSRAKSKLNKNSSKSLTYSLVFRTINDANSFYNKHPDNMIEVKGMSLSIEKFIYDVHIKIGPVKTVFSTSSRFQKQRRTSDMSLCENHTLKSHDEQGITATPELMKFCPRTVDLNHDFPNLRFNIRQKLDLAGRVGSSQVHH
jgi:RNA recognition motif-containing protein